MSYTEELLHEITKGSNATQDMIYLPTSSIGKIAHLGMQADREISDLQRSNELLQQEINKLKSKNSAA